MVGIETAELESCLSLPPIAATPSIKTGEAKTFEEGYLLPSKLKKIDPLLVGGVLKGAEAGVGVVELTPKGFEKLPKKTIRVIVKREALKGLTVELYELGKKQVGPFTKLWEEIFPKEVLNKLEKLNIIEGLEEDIAFKSQNGLLGPLDMLMVLQIKKSAKETEKKDLFEEMEDIEEKYFEGIPTLPEEAKYLRQKEIERMGTISIKEAEERIKKAQTILEEFEKQYGTKISSTVVKYSIKQLLEMVVI